MKIQILAMAIGAVMFFSSCTDDNSPVQDPTSALFKVAEGFAEGSGMKVALYSKSQTIFTGYQKLYVLLTDSATGTTISNALVKIKPMMDMGTMQHSAPFENPASTNAVNSLFPTAVVFIMPSMGGSWSVDVDVTNLQNGRTGSFSTSLTVADPVESKMKSFTSLHDGSKFFVALIEPSSPGVGINDLELAVYKRESAMDFPADSSFAISIVPEMPTMGHGSPNNIDPAHIGNGHYKGKVNFTMTGYWKININYFIGTEVADTTQYFDITF